MPNIFDQIDPDVSQSPADSSPEKNPFDFIDPDLAPQSEKSTVAGSFAGGVARNVGPMAAFMAAAPSGATVGGEVGSPLGPPGIFVGGLIGSIAAGSVAAWAAHKAQSSIADVVAPESVFGSKMEREQSEEHPLATELGGMTVIGIPNPMNVWRATETLLSDEGRSALMLLAKKGPQAAEEIPKYLQKEVENFHNVALSGGINAAFNAYDQVKSGNYSATDLAKAATEGLLFNMPWIHAKNPNTKYLKSIGLDGIEAQDALAEAMRQAKRPRVPGGGYQFVETPDYRPAEPDAGVAAPAAPTPTPLDPAQRGRLVVTAARLLIKRGVEPDIANRFASTFVDKSGHREVGENFRTDLDTAFKNSGLKDRSANQYSDEENLRAAAEANGFTEADIQNGIQKRAERNGEIAAHNQARMEEINPLPKNNDVPNENQNKVNETGADQAATELKPASLPKLNWFDDKGGPLMQPHLSGVKIKQADGSVVDAEFNGYYSPTMPSVGYVLPDGTITHTPLRKGDAIISPVPSPEEWSAIKSQGPPKPAEELNKPSNPPPELKAAPPVVKSGGNTSEYTLLDAVKEHGRLGGPNLDEAMAQMESGKSAKQIAAEYGDQYAGLQDVLETAFQQRTRKNAVGYKLMRKAYELAGLGGGGPQIDTTLDAIVESITKKGGGFAGGIPKDPGELISRAWAEAQDRVLNKPVSEKAAAKAEAARMEAAAETDANWKYWNKRNEPNKSDPLPLDGVEKGTTYTLNKKKMRVMDVQIDEDGRTTSIELEGEYGRQRWTAEDPTPLRMDKNSLKKSELNTDFLPTEDAAKPIPATEKADAPTPKTAAVVQPVVEQPSANLPAVQKYQLLGDVSKKTGQREFSPQPWSLVERIKQTSAEKEAGDPQLVKIKNDKTGETTVIEEQQLRKIKEQSPEQRAKNKASKTSERERLTAELGTYGFKSLKERTIEELRAMAERARAGKKFAAGEGTNGLGMSVDAATAAIHEALGTSGELPHGITVVRDEEATWGARIDDRNKITVNAAQISNATRAQQVILEEGLHGVWESDAVQRAWRDIRKSVNLVDIADARQERERLGLPSDPETIREEAAIAKLIKRQTNRNLVTKLLDAIRASFKKNFGINLPGTNRQLLIDAATDFLKGQRESLPGKRFVASNGIVLAPGMSTMYAITAFHGTPHKVKKFSTDKIGTGEGAQVYGWGLYFAENHNVGEEYRKSLTNRNTPSRETLEQFYKKGSLVPSYGGGTDRVLGFDWNGGNWSVTVQEVQKLPNGTLEEIGRPRTHRTSPSPRELEKAGIKPGAIYTVSINAEPHELIDYDKLLKDQHPKVKAALLDSGLVNEYGTSIKFILPDNAASAKQLTDIGIKGVRYLDQGSRNVDPGLSQTLDGKWQLAGVDEFKVFKTKSEGEKYVDEHYPELAKKRTYNYVIFNDADINITHENGVRVETADAVNNPAAPGVRFAAGEFDFGDAKKPEQKPTGKESLPVDQDKSRRISAINRELNDLQEKEKRTPADNARIVALEKELGQMDLFEGGTGGKISTAPGVKTPTQMAIEARQGKRLVGGDITSQGDMLEPKPKGQQSFFAAGDVPAEDKPEPIVSGQVAGVRGIGQLDIRESIPNAQRRLKLGVFDWDQPIDPVRTKEARRMFGLLTDPDTKSAFALELSQIGAPGGGGRDDFRETAPSLFVSGLDSYANRMAMAGDDSLMNEITRRSRDIASTLAGGRSTAGRALRGLQEQSGLRGILNIIAKRRAEQEGRKLGIGWEKYNELMDELNNAKLTEEEWTNLIADAPTKDGRTVGDIIDELLGRQSNTTRQQLELEQEIIGWKDKNNLEAAKWMNKLESLQTEWIGKPDGPKNAVREIIKEALNSFATKPKPGELDARTPLGDDYTEFTRDLQKKLEDVSVLPKVARGLAKAIWDKASNDWTIARKKAMDRAAKGGVASLLEAIQKSPQFLQTDPEWIRETTENWLMSNGLSREQAASIAGGLKDKFLEKLQTARELIAKRIIARGPPKSLEDIIAAIRAGLTNPDQQWSDILAKRNGWLPLTKEQNQQLALLEAKYSNPGMTPHERVAIQEQMNGIFRHSNLHDHGLIQVIAESQAASLLSGVRTSTLHIFQPLVAIMKDLPVQTIGLKTLAGQSDFLSMAKAMVNALKAWKPEFAEAWQKDAYSFSEHQTGFFHNELKRQYEIGQKEIEKGNAGMKSGSLKERAKAGVLASKGVLRIIFGTQQFVIRALQSANQAGMAVTREWKLALYTSKVMREAGLGQADVSAMVDSIAMGKEESFIGGKAMGLTDREATVRANDMYEEALERFFANKSLDGSKLKEAVDASNKDAFSSVGRRAPGIGEFDEGMVSRYTISKLIKIVSDLRREGGAGSIAAVMGAGFINIPFRMTRYLAGFSPYGFLRYGIHEYRVNRGKETLWKQSFANELQAQARLRDAVVGTALMSMFFGWQYGHHTSDDNADKKGFWIYATGNGPKSRVERDNWDKQGFKPLSLNMVMNGKVVGNFPITRVGEVLMAPLGMAAALDDLAWKRKEAAATGHEAKTGLAGAAEVPWQAIATYWDLMSTKGIFQTATHITQMGSGGGSGNTELMLAKAASSAISPVVLPYRQLLSNISDWMVGALDRSSVESATAANFPVVGLHWSSKAINRFGDQLYDQSWTGKLQRLGLPFMMHTAQTPENEALYGMQIEKGAAPPELRRSLLEDKYGPMTDKQFSNFAKISGGALKSATLSNLADLQGMEPVDVKKFLNKAASDGDKQAASELGLERARTLKKVSERPAGVGTPSGAGSASQASNPLAGARNSSAPRLSSGRPSSGGAAPHIGVTRLKAPRAFGAGKKKRIGPARLSIGRSKRPKRLKLPKNLRA